jgi:hypothetical protein
MEFGSSVRLLIRVLLAFAVAVGAAAAGITWLVVQAFS